MDPVTSLPDQKRRKNKKTVGGKKFEEGVPVIVDQAGYKRKANSQNRNEYHL
jgi:hypothetical protein